MCITRPQDTNAHRRSLLNAVHLPLYAHRYTLPAAKDKLQLLPESKLMIALGAFKEQLLRSVQPSESTATDEHLRVGDGSS